MSDDHRTFWGKLAIVATILSAIAALVSVLHQVGFFNSLGISSNMASHTDNIIAPKDDVNILKMVPSYDGNSNPTDFNFDKWYNQQINEIAKQGLIDQKERERLYMLK